MTHGKRNFVLTYLLVVLPIAVHCVADGCPSKEDAIPCTCKELGLLGVDVTCRNADNADLARVASHLRGREVYLFSIYNSKSSFIKHDAFKGVKVKRLIIERSTLATLTDNGEAFVGLEDHLKQLFIVECVFKTEFDWSVLKNLRNLEKLSIDTSLQLDTLGTDVMKDSVPSSLEDFYFTKNNISSVSDRAFDSFKNVADLTLKNNKITNVKRTMFPNPAFKLRMLDISSNLIERFPEDMFINMPRLGQIFISNNKILVLNEKTFSPVWGKLFAISISGNPLHCDCLMSWLPQKRTPFLLNGKCTTPPELQGKELKKLNSKDFTCYV